jgi:hypothetical protein
MLDLKKMLTKLMQAPIVVEQGTSGIWTYRKWSDGTAECWGKITNTSFDITKAWGSMYISYAGTSGEFYANFPTNLFIEAPVETATAISSGSMFPFMAGISGGTTTKDHTAHYLMGRGTSMASVGSATLCIYAVGKWK